MSSICPCTRVSRPAIMRTATDTVRRMGRTTQTCKAGPLFLPRQHPVRSITGTRKVHQRTMPRVPGTYRRRLQSARGRRGNSASGRCRRGGHRLLVRIFRRLRDHHPDGSDLGHHRSLVTGDPPYGSPPPTWRSRRLPPDRRSAMALLALDSTIACSETKNPAALVQVLPSEWKQPPRQSLQGP